MKIDGYMEHYPFPKRAKIKPGQGQGHNRSIHRYYVSFLQYSYAAVNAAWNNCFREIFSCCWCESPSVYTPIWQAELSFIHNTDINNSN